MQEGKSNDILTEKFTKYFLEKIEKIRQQFINIKPFKPTKTDMKICTINNGGGQTGNFQHENKSCEVNVLQSHLIKDMLLACLDIITTIVNLLLKEGQFFMEWKTAVVKS